jgi:polyhydroxyalkanoate synthase
MRTDNRRHFETLDRSQRAAQAKFIQGISPYALSAAFVDWAVHFTLYTGTQLDVLTRAAESANHL